MARANAACLLLLLLACALVGAPAPAEGSRQAPGDAASDGTLSSRQGMLVPGQGGQRGRSLVRLQGGAGSPVVGNAEYRPPTACNRTGTRVSCYFCNYDIIPIQVRVAQASSERLPRVCPWPGQQEMHLHLHP